MPKTVPNGFDAWLANPGGDYLSPMFQTFGLPASVFPNDPEIGCWQVRSPHPLPIPRALPQPALAMACVTACGHTGPAVCRQQRAAAALGPVAGRALRRITPHRLSGTLRLLGSNRSTLPTLLGRSSRTSLQKLPTSPSTRRPGDAPPASWSLVTLLSSALRVLFEGCLKAKGLCAQVRGPLGRFMAGDRAPAGQLELQCRGTSQPRGGGADPANADGRGGPGGDGSLQEQMENSDVC